MNSPPDRFDPLTGSLLDRIRKPALALGALCLVAVGIGAFFDTDAFFQSYLLAVLYWSGIALGALSILMLHHLTGGRWGFTIRRPLEAAAETLWPLLFLSLPIWLGTVFEYHDLYPWASPTASENPTLAHKGPYLNPAAFNVRTVFYFVLWLTFTTILVRISRRQDHSDDPGLNRRLRLLSGPGLVLYGFAMSFAAIDWVMSLEPHWYSTVYGAHFIVGHALAALAFSTLLLQDLSRRHPVAEAMTPQVVRDLGNLHLTFVMLWGYTTLSQFLIMWAGNLPHDIEWYVSRGNHGWEYVAGALVIFHLAVPFILLLLGAVKTHGRKLAFVSCLLLVMRWVDIWWFESPAFHSDHIQLHWMDIVSTLGLGGVWLGFFAWRLSTRPLLPLGDERFALPAGAQAESS